MFQITVGERNKPKREYVVQQNGYINIFYVLLHVRVFNKMVRRAVNSPYANMNTNATKWGPSA